MQERNCPGNGWLAGVIITLSVLSIIGCSQAPAPSSSPSTQSPKEPAKATAKAGADSNAAPANNASKDGKSLVKISVPYNAVAATHSILWITKEKGLFEKYGLDVEVPFIASSTTLVQAMVSGQIGLAHVGGNAVVAADLAGADLIIIAGTGNSLGFSLYVQPSIKSPEDLKGKAIGVSKVGSSTDFGARYVLKHFGLEPDKDVAIVETGGSPESLAAVQSGGVQGAIFGPPTTLKARQAGLVELANLPQLGVAYPTATMAVSKKYLSQNTETVKTFLKAFTEGIAAAKQDKEFAMSVIGKYTQTDDRDVLDETFDFYVNKLFGKVPLATVDAVQAILNETAQTNAKAKEAKPEDFLDMSYIKELESSGFIDKLYKN